jgi:hypothetical protein
MSKKKSTLQKILLQKIDLKADIGIRPTIIKQKKLS